MREYILRDESGEEFDLPMQKWKEVLRPKTYPSEVIEGWGTLRLKVADCEISFSPEPPGTHVVFECEDISPAVADAVVKEILENAEMFTGRKGVVIPLQ